MMFDEISASSLVKVDIEGNKVSESDYDINPAGFTIHSAIHAAWEDDLCVVHLHTKEVFEMFKLNQWPDKNHHLIT